MSKRIAKSSYRIEDFWNAWWQQTYQAKSIVLGSVRMLRTNQTHKEQLIYWTSVLSAWFIIALSDHYETSHDQKHYAFQRNEKTNINS